MSEASKDPKRESLKNRAELLKQELSAAITSRDVASAVGILKKLQGMPSEFVPADLSSLAEQLKSEISSNSAPGPESAAEAARKAKEEEERKIMEAGERAFNNLKGTNDEVESYRTGANVKEGIEKTKLAAEKRNRGESLNDTEARDVADHTSEHMPQLLRNSRKIAKTPTKEELEEEARKRELLVRKFGPGSKEVKDHDEKWKDQLKRRDNERREHVVILESAHTSLADEKAQKECRERGVDPEAVRKECREVAAMLFDPEFASIRGLEGEIDHGAQAEKATAPKAKQGTDVQSQGVISVPASKAKSDKIAISLTEGGVSSSAAITSPPPTPPRVIRNRNNPRTK